MDDPGPSAAFYSQFPSTSEGPIRPPSPGPSTIDKPEVDSTYYTLLNLPRSASESQIRERYRHLASTFHPDRQRSTSTLSAAHTQFTQIQRAYEVLIDPRQRIIYDHFGEEGLTTSWEVGVRNKSPEELRRHFANISFENEVRDAESLVKPRSNISVVVDARATLMRKDMWRNPGAMRHDPVARLQRLGIGRINMSHGFEIPLGKVDKGKSRTQLVVAGNMVAWNGKGGGNVTGTVRHQFSSWAFGEVAYNALAPRALSMKGTSTIDENTQVAMVFYAFITDHD
jgi:DnaJ family protein C protein 11